MNDLSDLMRSQLELFRRGKIRIADSEMLTDLVDQIIKAHGYDTWVESGFMGLKSISAEEALKYLQGENFKKADKFLKPDDLEVGMTVILHHTKFPKQHLWGHSYKIAGLELPYLLLEPAVKSMNDQELMVYEAKTLALRKCSEQYFNAQRKGNKLESKDYSTSPESLPF